MLYLLLGFILGVAVSWFWQTQFTGVPAFKKLMQKELAVNGQLGSITALKKKLELVEARLAKIKGGASSGEDLLTNGGDALIEKPAETLSLVHAADSRIEKTDQVGRGRARARALALWREGRTAAEIATRTRLGQGEVELIISFGGRAAEGLARVEHPEKGFLEK